MEYRPEEKVRQERKGGRNGKEKNGRHSSHRGIAISYIGLGNIYHRQGRYLDAITQFEKVLEIAPDSLGALAAHYNAGRAYHALGIKVKAEKHFREVIRLAPDSEIAKLAQQYIERMK
ncbi:MAG: hypothetical protein DDT40_00295 [candidate division WS2 bacterium]|nr:hypothetical protein [Bacillota bacterium]MBT9150129.1 hypothetical protein [Candidatus Psychracetigena formicireducens]